MVGGVRKRRKASALALAIGFRSGDEIGQLSLLEYGREVMEWRDDRHANRLGIYRTTRPPLDAADEPVARSAMDSLMDYGGPQKFAAVGAAGSAAILGVIVFKLLKQLSQRPRPCQLEPHCWSRVLPPDK